MTVACGGGLLNRDRPDEFAVQRQARWWFRPISTSCRRSPVRRARLRAARAAQTLEALFGGPQARSSVETRCSTRRRAPGIRGGGDPDTATVAKGA